MEKCVWRILCDNMVSIWLKDKFYMTAMRFAKMYGLECQVLDSNQKKKQKMSVVKMIILC